MHIAQASRAAADVAVLAGGIAEDQGVRRHVARDDRARADEREGADSYAAHDHRARADRRAVFDQRRCDLPVVGALESAIRRDRARSEVVGEADVRADEHAVFQRDALEDRNVVLYLDVRADAHVRVDIDALADVAAFAYMSMFAHVGLPPDARARSDLRVGRYFRCRVSVKKW